MLATPGKPFSDPLWLFELKYDGYRLLAQKRDGQVTLFSRAGHDFTATFPEIAELFAALPFDRFIVDADVVVLDERGLPSFALLQKRGRLTRRADVQRAILDRPTTAGCWCRRPRVRPLPAAPVSMPLEWSQVNGRLKLERFDIRSARKWLRQHGDPLLPVLRESIDMLAAVDALTRQLDR